MRSDDRSKLAETSSQLATRVRPSLVAVGSQGWTDQRERRRRRIERALLIAATAIAAAIGLCVAIVVFWSRRPR